MGEGNGGDGGPGRRPGVGVGVIVTRGREVLLVRRRHHGAGSWSTPGGYLDPGEGPEECGAREVREETGLVVADVAFLGLTNDVHPDGKHNVTIWLSARAAGGEATVAAPEELDDIGWFPWERLPQPLYLSTRNFVEGQTYPPDAQRAVAGLD